ncbi:MAG: sulfatase-like hydrolase/transferase, partial [Phycisphaeraceae bacterium]
IFHGGYREPRGWDAYQAGFGGKRADKVAPPGEGIRIKTGVIDTDNDSETGEGRMADWAIAQLNRPHDKPFFIAMGLYQPHEPWVSPTRYYQQHPLDAVHLPDVPEDDLGDVPAAGRLFADEIVGFHHWNDHADISAVPGARRQLVRGYLASCTFSDSNVGRLLDALHKSPHADNTVVVLWGDHGFHLGEKNAWRKMTLWERGTRTPLIVMLPGQVKGTRVDPPVSLLDIYPTLVALCGLQIDQPLDGVSLGPLLDDPDADWDRPVIMSHGPGNFAVRSGPWRLIRYTDGSEELYNIAQDPAEHHNLALDAKHDDTRRQLRGHLPKTWVYNVCPRFERFGGAFAKPPTSAIGESPPVTP